MLLEGSLFFIGLSFFIIIFKIWIVGKEYLGVNLENLLCGVEEIVIESVSKLNFVLFLFFF